MFRIRQWTQQPFGFLLLWKASSESGPEWASRFSFHSLLLSLPSCDLSGRLELHIQSGKYWEISYSKAPCMAVSSYTSLKLDAGVSIRTLAAVTISISRCLNRIKICFPHPPSDGGCTALLGCFPSGITQGSSLLTRSEATILTRDLQHHDKEERASQFMQGVLWPRLLVAPIPPAHFSIGQHPERWPT